MQLHEIDARRQPLWLSDLRARYAENPNAKKVILHLIRGGDEERDYTLCLPSASTEEEQRFLLRYVASTVYNILSVFSGSGLRVYCDEEEKAYLVRLPELFDGESGYSKVLHIAHRIYGGFSFSFSPLSDYCESENRPLPMEAQLANRLSVAQKEADTRCCIGIDVGGSDIKIAASACGKLISLSEYNWNPAAYTSADDVIEPILAVARAAKSEIGKTGNRPDAIGLSFPDVVIDDAIVGGETPKTRGIRENKALDYETEFARFRGLKAELLSLCTPGGSVRIINDGNMAAFTAAMELAAGGRTDEIRNGVLAHSLGTDLGTGWLRSDGTIPSIPLELYDLLLDLGHEEAAALPPEDLRSVCNENSGMAGVRRYLGQSAAYRLAWEFDPGMLEGYAQWNGGTLAIPTAPEDLRKPCLEHLMALASDGKAEAEAIFRIIGRNLAVVTRELSWLAGETPGIRFLFGRFVKSPRCFSLLSEGFRELIPDIKLKAADDSLANTALMKQLAAVPDKTVAQFGQAIGAIYFSQM